MITKQQKHLNYKERINLGSYYTNTEHVSCVWNFINPHIDNNFTILDSSCGYGNFLINSNNKKIGNDIDNIAIVEAQKNIKNISFFNFNALEEINRKKYFILDALFHNSQLRKYYANFDFSQSRYRSIAKEKINLYFKQLLRNHYAS